MANNAQDHISMKVINDKELYKLFTELETKLQNRIVLSGMRKAANVILKEAKSNFKKSQKEKSKTGYKNFNKSFKTSPIKNPDNGFGLKVGIKNYKYRWLQWGTEERSYSKRVKRSIWRKNKTAGKPHKTGRIKPTNFFYSAVEDKMQTANNMISEGVVLSLKRTVEKYNKK